LLGQLRLREAARATIPLEGIRKGKSPFIEHASGRRPSYRDLTNARLL
jgi:hypothetical protein